MDEIRAHRIACVGRDDILLSGPHEDLHGASAKNIERPDAVFGRLLKTHEFLRAAASSSGRNSNHVESGPCVSHQFTIGYRQHTREQRAPHSLPDVVGDEVLADFKFDVKQAASLAMRRNRVIRRIAHAIGFVVTDDKPLFAFQQRLQDLGEARIMVVEHSSMPGPRHAHENRGEAMHRDQRDRLARLSPPIEFGCDPIMVGSKNLSQARAFLSFAQADVSRDGSKLTDLRDRRLRPWRTVTVDDQARIVLLHQGGV